MLKLLLVLLLLAVLIYAGVRLLERRPPRRGRGGLGPGAQPGPRPGGPIGPDDDDDFLWGLNKKRRHPDED